MYHITERNDRRGQRHALILAVSLHLALVAMLYFKMSGDATDRPAQAPAKVNVGNERPAAKAVLLP